MDDSKSKGQVLVDERIRKLNELKEQGINPYPYRFDVTATSSMLKEKYSSLKPEEKTSDVVSVAGRIVLFRRMGKAVFMTIRQDSGDLQLYIRSDDVGSDEFELVKKFDLGDFIGASGFIFKTKMGELTVYVSKFEMLSKTIRPLPDKYHGLQDQELKYRKRHLDLIMNKESKEVLTKRMLILKHIREFLNYRGVVFTDCGGFQSSSSFFERKSKKGLHFRSPYDNKRVILTPKSIMEIQWALDCDVAMMLDDMSGYGISYEEAEIAMLNTHRWGVESLDHHKKLRALHNKKDGSRQLLFGIVQGNFFSDLRKQSAEFLSKYDFDGFAIGGVAIGEPKDDMYLAVNSSLPYLAKNKIKYVMGLGSPVDLLEMIGLGVDCFDSIYPTQNARHSSIFTRSGKLYIDKGRYSEDFSPIEQGCECHTCKNYTRAYLNHLTKINEPAAHRLKSVHNQFFLQKLFDEAKTAIKEKKFYEFKEEFKKSWLKDKKNNLIRAHRHNTTTRDRTIY